MSAKEIPRILKKFLWKWYTNKNILNFKNVNIFLYLQSNFKTFMQYNPCIKRQTVQFLPGIPFLSHARNSDISQHDVEDNVAHLLTLARIALEKGDTDRAEAIIEMGLKICEEHKVYMAMPYIYDILASIAFAQGNIEKAENLLVNVIEKMVQIGTPEDNNHIIDFKLRLARIYSNHKNNDLAEIGFKTCLDTQKAKIVEGDTSTRTGMLYVNVLFWYGVHMIRNENYRNARELLNMAYDYSAKIKGLSPYQEMVILYTLADLNLELEQYDIALQHMLNAVLLGKGISSADLPRCYVKLAKIYMKLESYDHAKITALEGAKLSTLFNNTDMAEEASTLLEEINLRQNL